MRFIKVNSYPATCHGEHAIAKYYVDQATSICVHGPSLISIDHNEEMKLDKKNSVFFNCTLTSPKMIKELISKAFVDFIPENKRNRRELSTVFNNQDNEFDKITLTNLDRFTPKKNPKLDKEDAKKISMTN